MTIIEWCEKNLLKVEHIEGERSLTCNEKNFYIVESVEVEGEQKIFDEDFNLILSHEDFKFLDSFQFDYFLFQFGGIWYYTPVNKKDVELNIFKYFGIYDSVLNLNFSSIGCHTGYELCNGSRLAEDWVKKCKFLNIKNLGICENNTLAGTLKFQEECVKEKIKPIIGETVVVKKDEDENYLLKLFVKDQIGWQNLLNIDSQINVFNEGYVTEEFLMTHSKGLYCIFSCESKLDKELIKKIKTKCEFEDHFFQIDLVQYQSEEKDKENLNNIQNYLKSFQKELKPILISDAYYLDQEDHDIKNIINKIGKVGFKYQSKDQYFKPVEDIINQANNISLIYEKDSVLFNAIENTNYLSDNCDFLIDVENFHLPKYVMTEDEKKQFDSNEDLFWHLIGDGFERKIAGKVDDEQIYWDRVSYEVKIISDGDIIDYFLILADILNWCRRNNICVGIGRGSSGASLAAYLLNVVEIDPIKYGLIFERFLNAARIKAGELVDIDSDIASNRRDDVKRYMEERYGLDYVASVGTYGNFKNKGIIKDFGREMSLNYADVNFMTSLMSKDSEDGELIDLFKESNKEPKLKDFINKNYKLINKISKIIWQPKTQSIHASAVLIVPFEDEKGIKKNIYDWIPVKKIDGVLITQWEGKQIEAAGFLKEDILATLQLEKFQMILDLIEKNYGIIIDWTKDIPIYDKEIFEKYWHNGYTEDVFQFTTDNLKKYCKYLKPDSLDELIAANALARPGAMLSNAHIDYVKVKFGLKESEYDYLLEDVTKSTFGLYCFQEQIMRSFQIITDSSLEDADLFRKVITKLKSGAQNDENYNHFKKLFTESYIKKESSEENAIKVWDKLIAFSKYGFNLAHAACYAYEAWVCSWFKAKYPLEFWVTSLTYSKDDDIEKKIYEIEKTGSIELHSPDINISREIYTYSVEKNAIYWSLNSISFAGEKSVTNIMNERDENGLFDSFDSFIKRMEGKRINKKIVSNFIICGCFDEIEKIEKPIDRINLLRRYLGSDLHEDFLEQSDIIKDYFWLMKQKELCGIGNINFSKINSSLAYNKEAKFSRNLRYLDAEEILDEENENKQCICIAIINKIDEFNTKNGKAGRVELNQNGKMITLTCWNEFWTDHHIQFKKNKGKVIAISAIIRSFRNSNTLQCNNYTKYIFI